MPNVKTILMPTDFSESSEEAVTYAQLLADKFGATLHLLHVVQDPYTQPWGAEAYGVSLPNLLEEMEQNARARLETILPESERTRFNVQMEIKVGSPFVEILRYASDKNIDLIVMGTHGRGAVAHMFLGSVAEKVVRKAACPVLIVRQAGHEFVRP
jgi:nucleotide-binding universal stress UspA family protein